MCLFCQYKVSSVYVLSPIWSSLRLCGRSANTLCSRVLVCVRVCVLLVIASFVSLTKCVCVCAADWCACCRSLQHGMPLITPGPALPPLLLPVLHFDQQPYGCPAMAKDVGSPDYERPGMGTSGNGQCVSAYGGNVSLAQVSAPCVLSIPAGCGKHYACGVCDSSPPAVQEAIGE